MIPVKALTLALEACRDFLRCREHLDIDDPVNKVFFFNIIKLFYFYVVTSFEIIKIQKHESRVCQDSYNECRIQYIGE